MVWSGDSVEDGGTQIVAAPWLMREADVGLGEDTAAREAIGWELGVAGRQLAEARHPCAGGSPSGR